MTMQDFDHGAFCSNAGAPTAANFPLHPRAALTGAWKSRGWHSLGMLLGLLFLGSADARQPAATKPSASTTEGKGSAATAQSGVSRLWMTVGERRFAVTLHDNATGRAFADMLPLTLEMEELNGNEKKAELPMPLPGNASRPGTIHNGDLLLYRSDTLVLFYKTFSSPYSYANVGRVDDPAGLSHALGQQHVGVAFTPYK